eukprot:1602897-Rhodomonas_salina.2
MEVAVLERRVCIVLRACYAMSGTERGYAATRLLLWLHITACIQVCSYALATRCPVLSSRILLPQCWVWVEENDGKPRYQPMHCPVLRWRKASSAYAPATRCPVLR